MSLFDDVVDFAKKNFVPKGIGMDYLMETPAAQAMMQAAMMATPGVPLGAAALNELANTETGKKVMASPFVKGMSTLARDLMEGLPPGEDDALSAGWRAASKYGPESMAVVAPLISKLGIVKPRGAAYIPGVHHFESKLAEALDKKFIAPGNPEDLISLKEIRAELGKLPGLGVKKEELAHFNLGPQIESMLSQGKTKISREELATLIDKQMPRIEVATDTERHKQFTLPSDWYDPRPPYYESYIFHAPPADLPGGGSIEPFKDVKESTSSGHYDQGKYPNILGWTRTTRRPFGVAPPPIVGETDYPLPEVAKYIEEGQSDFVSKARKSGEEEKFPLASIHDLMMKFIDRISREKGEEAVGWTPPSVQIARWGGSKQPKEGTINNPYSLTIEDFIKSLGAGKIKEAYKGSLPIPRETLAEIEKMVLSTPEFQAYKQFAESEEGKIVRLFDSSREKFYSIRGGIEDDLRKKIESVEGKIYKLPEPRRLEVYKEIQKEMASNPVYAKAKDEYEKVYREVQDRYRAISGDKWVFPESLSSKEFSLRRATKDKIEKQIEQNPINYTGMVAHNYTGFENVYGKEMPKVAGKILERRGGGKVFNERVVGNPEEYIAEQYAERYPESEGYVQPPDIGSFFYRIPKEQRGKPVPYPDSLWGLLGAAGLAGMMEAGKKDRQPQ